MNFRVNLGTHLPSIIENASKFEITPNGDLVIYQYDGPPARENHKAIHAFACGYWRTITEETDK